MAVLKKIIKNLKQGTFFKNGYKYVARRIYIKTNYNNLFISRDKYRVALKDIYNSFPPVDSNFITIGNYYASKSVELDSKSIIYSIGVGDFITFDIEMAEKYNCDVFMYDPTPLSINFMKDYEDNKKLKFFPYGIWTEKTTLEFFTSKHGGSSSALNNYGSETNSFKADCNTLDFFMKQNNHSEIDYLKMDIEGAALPILIDLFDKKLLPKQIMVEFEAPFDRTEKAQKPFIESLNKIIARAKKKGYDIFTVEGMGAKYFAIELLFVKAN